MPVTPMSPAALAVDAIACVSPVTDDAVISPLNSDTLVACAVAAARAWVPSVASTLVVTDVAETTEPSAGNAKAPSNDTAVGGAAATRVLAPDWFGTITLIAQARPVAPADRSAMPCEAPIACTATNAAMTGSLVRTGL